MTTYEENVWRELDPEVASQLSQTEAEVTRLSGVLSVLRDEVESEKKAQEQLLREFKTQVAVGTKLLGGGSDNHAGTAAAACTGSNFIGASKASRSHTTAPTVRPSSGYGGGSGRGVKDSFSGRG